MPARRVLSVGQCGFDHGNIARLLQGAFGAEVLPADSASEALSLLRRQPVQLVLVNRLFDHDGASGLDFIRELKRDEQLCHIPVMLVSNHPEAQAEAVAAGAVPGFGKSALGQPRIREQLAVYLEQP
jgi:two-component system chemotaxis response regulator CheY